MHFVQTNPYWLLCAGYVLSRDRKYKEVQMLALPQRNIKLEAWLESQILFTHTKQ